MRRTIIYKLASYSHQRITLFFSSLVFWVYLSIWDVLSVWTVRLRIQPPQVRQEPWQPDSLLCKRWRLLTPYAVSMFEIAKDLLSFANQFPCTRKPLVSIYFLFKVIIKVCRNSLSKFTSSQVYNGKQQTNEGLLAWSVWEKQSSDFTQYSRVPWTRFYPIILLSNST